MLHDLFKPSDDFTDRHLGPNAAERDAMLAALGLERLSDLIDEVIPSAIRFTGELELPRARTESEALATLGGMMAKNQVLRSFIGMGYYNCITPAVIQRNILENPGWYTQYTPYQAEISQGRLEVLLNFQTMVADLTGLPLSNASLLDEATAAAEAMHVCLAASRHKKKRFFVADSCHPQTIAVIQTRAEPMGVTIEVGDPNALLASARERDIEDLCGVLVQYPDTNGHIADFASLADKVHDLGALLVVATDLMALTLLTPPGEWGADIAVGSSQRFGVPLGYGGPHAAFISAQDRFRRQIPGRLVGVSRDARGKLAYRLALQTREQHIRRDKATSNICTAQVLLAVMASLYAVYHGPDGLRTIARRIRAWAQVLRTGLLRRGYRVSEGPIFDTVRIDVGADEARAIVTSAEASGINVRQFEDGALGISVDEVTSIDDVVDLLQCFAKAERVSTADVEALCHEVSSDDAALAYPAALARKSPYLTHENFHRYHTEHEFLRYVHRLQARDLSLTTSMIALGSCTMKLNATSEMVPVSWPEVAGLHPYAPVSQAAGYMLMFRELEQWLATITGFAAVSLQPNAGAQGEYAGLLAIRGYHLGRGQSHRDVCLIPTSAHGTNPASAVMAGMKVVAVKCDDGGNIDVGDLRNKAEKHRDALAALMITYPSTHGVFETQVREICDVVHECGGQVYMDGANMNAQVGLCRPIDVGADVCHLNLHKTFCIPHGGGGPGMGPIAVAAHLAPYVPRHPLSNEPQPVGPVAAAPYGSPSILPISWMYIAMMGEKLRLTSEVAILSANYMAERLRSHYPVLYAGQGGRVAHEFILDCRPIF